MEATKSKYKTGWRFFLIKAGCAIAVVFLVELLLAAFVNNDALGKVLLPFHNHYYSFSGHYLTRQGMGSDFSADSFATTRFVICFILGYFIYGAISITVWLIRPLQQHAGRINSVLFFVLVAGAFMLAFFFPPRIAVIDTAAKEVRVTRYNYFFIPTSAHIPFSDISKVDYSIATDYDGYNKKYINYLVISLTIKSGIKIPMGEMQAGEQKGTLVHKPAVEVSAEKKQMAEEVVKGIEGVVKD